MDTLFQDVKYSLRGLIRTPGFTLTAIASLGIGLAASITVFTIVNAIYFAPLPFHDVERLVLIETSRVPSLCHPDCPAYLNLPEISTLNQRLQSVDGIAGVTSVSAVAVTPTGPARIVVAVASGDIFSLLGLRPLIGRTLIPADDRPNAENVVVLSHHYWMTNYGGDTSVIGRTLSMDGLFFRIVGVMPPSAEIGAPVFRGDSVTAPLFIAAGPAVVRRPATIFLSVIARLRPSASRNTLHAQLEVLVAPPDKGLVRQARLQGFAPAWRSRVTGLRQAHAKAYASTYPLFLATVLVVMLVACVNLAGLYAARYSGRRHEIAVQMALGAGRARMVRRFLADGVLMSFVALGVSLILARWAVTLTRMLPMDAMPYWASLHIDFRVAIFALALASACGAACTLVPALVVTSTRGALGFHDASRTFAGGRSSSILARVLVSAEIACSLALLTGAGLLAKTFVDVSSSEIRGYPKRAVLMGNVGDQSVADAPWTSARRLALAERLLDRLKGIPGVMAASVAGRPRDASAEVIIDGQGEMTPGALLPWTARAVTPDYFSANGLELVRGRTFGGSDNQSSAPVGIVDEETAKHFFLAGAAIGQRVKFGGASHDAQWLTIVGVVATSACPQTEACRYSPWLYLPMAQSGLTAVGYLSFFVRTHGNADQLKPAIRDAVRAVDPGVMVARLFSAEWRWERVVAPLRLNATVISMFALFALVMAGVGTYSVLALVVAQRTPEIGIRRALGATATSVHVLMLRSVAFMLTTGLLAGVSASYALTRILRAMLYSTSPTDPGVFALASVVVSGAALFGAYLPARRATRIDPLGALRVSGT